MGGMSFPGLGGAGLGNGAGGGGNFLTDLFTNKLFLQMLGAAGTDLLGGTGGKNTGNAIQQNVGAQSYAKLLAQMLGGQMPEGGKISMDATGMKIQMPNLAGSQVAGQSAPAPAQSPTPVSSNGGGGGQDDLISNLSRALNPFAPSLPSNINPADLAGVSPELIGQAVGLQQNQEQLHQRRFSDIVDAVYKQGLLRNQEVQAGLESRGLDLRAKEYETSAQNAGTSAINALRQWQETQADLGASPIQPPGFARPISLKEFNTFSAADKAYTFYTVENEARNKALVAGGGKPEPLLSRLDWENRVTTTNKKDYEAAKADGSFKGGLMDFILEKAKAGAIKISTGDKLDEAAARSQLQGQGYFNNPDWIKDIDTHIKDEYVQEAITTRARSFPGGITRKNLAEATAVEKGKAVESRILATPGTQIIDRKLSEDRKTVIWIVKWPEIRDANGKVIRQSTSGKVTYGVRN